MPTEPVDQDRKYNFSLGLDWVAFFAFIFGLIILFSGDPDLHDVWIKNLSNDCLTND